jgi:hypothetical protein
MSTSSGAAKAEIEVIDLTALINGALKGYICIIGPTLRGKIGTPIFAPNWGEFEKKLGGLRADSDFPLYCQRLLNAGAKLYVSRAGHYTDISDKTTLAGTKAAVTPAIAAVTEVRATATYTVTAGTSGGSGVHILKVGAVTIGSYAVTGSDTFAQQATAIRAAIETLSGTTGYNAAGTGVDVVISAPVGTGAAGNDLVLSEDNTGDAAGTIVQFDNGVTAVAAQSAVFTAKEVGTGYNGIIVTIVAAASGQAGKVDILVTVPGTDSATESYKNVTAALGTTEKAELNARSQLFTIGTIVANLPIATGTFSGGLQDISAIVAADYIGDANEENGIHSFNSVDDATKIMIPHTADHTIEVALQTYVEMRGDMIGLISTPVGLSADGAVDWRERTGAYATGVAIDSWQMALFTGGLTVYDSLAKVDKDLHELSDVGGLFAVKDAAKGEWFTAAGPKRGKIKNISGIPTNFGSAAQSDNLDFLVNHRINPVIKHSAFGPVLWGNATMQVADTLLSQLHIAELTIFMKRTLKPVLESQLFDPNDFQTWRNIHRQAKKFLDLLVTKRAIFEYKYQGDQEATKLSDLVINNADDVQAGQYFVNVLFKPIGALYWIKMRLALVPGSVSFEEISQAELE